MNRDVAVIYVAHEGAARGHQNMQRDLELAQLVHCGELRVAFRTYTWKPWTLSLGKHQSIAVVDQDEVYRRGYDVVHRPTGGRAVFHAEEVTYACMITSSQPQRVYHAVHSLILQALQPILPAGATHTNTPTSLPQHYASSGPLGTTCFTAHARTEITIAGKKLVGSAQRIIDGVVLQHGSILVGRAHLQLPDLLTLSTEDRKRTLGALEQSSTSLQDACNQTIDTGIVVEELLKTFNSENIERYLLRL